MKFKQAVRIRLPDDLYKKFKEAYAEKRLSGPKFLEEIIVKRYKSNRKTVNEIAESKNGFYTASIRFIDPDVKEKLIKMAEKVGENHSNYLSKIVAEYLGKEKK